MQSGVLHLKVILCVANAGWMHIASKSILRVILAGVTGFGYEFPSKKDQI